MCIGISTSTSISISITVLIVRLRQITRYEAWHGLAHDKWAGWKGGEMQERSASSCSVVLPGAARCFLVLLTGAD
jgi:hypothetical protein